jgi:hypothetical protein
VSRLTPCGCSRRGDKCRCPTSGSCRWPKGCNQQPTACCGSNESGKHGFCTYHDGVIAGHIEGSVRQTVTMNTRPGVSPSQVVSDEQRELEAILRVLRAS